MTDAVATRAGKKLRGWLKAKKMTQVDFARKIGCSKSQLAQWISGYRRPKDDARKLIQKHTKGAVDRDLW